MGRTKYKGSPLFPNLYKSSFLDVALLSYRLSINALLCGFSRTDLGSEANTMKDTLAGF